jgi:hypothetical protein
MIMADQIPEELAAVQESQLSQDKKEIAERPEDAIVRLRRESGEAYKEFRESVGVLGSQKANDALKDFLDKNDELFTVLDKLIPKIDPNLPGTAKVSKDSGTLPGKGVVRQESRFKV